MLRIGLTGGVSCGKSAIADMLAQRGAFVVKADDIAHQLMQPGQPVYEQVVEQFGRGILKPDGTINRVRLAKAAFAPGSDSKTRVEELNRIVHPAVIQHQDAWMAETGRRYQGAVTVVEAALILEAGVAPRFDKIVVVTCTSEQKVERFARRQGVSLEEARQEVARRSAAQLPDEEKIKAADYVIDNSGPLDETERQVDRVYAELKRLAEDKTDRPH